MTDMAAADSSLEYLRSLGKLKDKKSILNLIN